MRGSTKFPSPGYAGPAWIYAIRLPLTQQGFDTEEWQTQVGGLWQPGEKALYRIEPSSIMASVPMGIRVMATSPPKQTSTSFPGSRRRSWIVP